LSQSKNILTSPVGISVAGFFGKGWFGAALSAAATRLKGGLRHGIDFANSVSFVAFWEHTEVALQQKLGLWTERRSWPIAGYRFGTPVAGSVLD